MDAITADMAAITVVIGATAKILDAAPQLRRVGVFVSCGVGVLYAFGLRPEGDVTPWVNIAVHGIMVGLSASGGYSGMRSAKLGE